MIHLVFEFGKTLALGILLNDYFRRNYPSKYREIGIEIVFNIIYFYSYCEMHIKNGVQYIENKNQESVKFIRELFRSKKKVLDIEFVKDNKILLKNSKEKYLSSEEVEIIPDYDFVLYSDISENMHNIKILQKNCKLSLLNAETYDYELSTIKFILLEFIIGEKCYKIDLATNKYNFYVKDNILDKNFFLYYLRYIHTEQVIFEDDNIELDEIIIKIIDDNVNIKKISLIEDVTKSIKLHKYGYEIISKQS
jgi:hypothetical protein